MRGRDEIVLWPIYFDSTVTRVEGRKVPKRQGKPSPTLEMIGKALNRLGVSYKLVPDAVYPHFPWKKTGLILAKKGKPKNQVLKAVAEELGREV
jgi:signal recognition particle subunit SRP19